MCVWAAEACDGHPAYSQPPAGPATRTAHQRHCQRRSREPRRWTRSHTQRLSRAAGRSLPRPRRRHNRRPVGPPVPIAASEGAVLSGCPFSQPCWSPTHRRGTHSSRGQKSNTRLEKKVVGGDVLWGKRSELGIPGMDARPFNRAALPPSLTAARGIRACERLKDTAEQ